MTAEAAPRRVDRLRATTQSIMENGHWKYVCVIDTTGIWNYSI